MGVRTAMRVWGSERIGNRTERRWRTRLQKRAETGTAQSPAEGLTWATEIGTGDREAMRRACCTSEAVPAPPGKATTSTEAIEPGEV